MSDMPEPAFLDLVGPHTGHVIQVRSTVGNSSATTVLVEAERGSFFVKAAPNRPGGRRDSLLREALINPHVVPLSPAMTWQVQDAAWIVLGFEAIDARRCDLVPDSPDLPAVVEILNQIAALPVPEMMRDWVEDRWDGYVADEADIALFRGETLLYTDIGPDNILIGDSRTWAVDWAWPTRGAAFIDPALLVVQLIAAGHTAASAESWAAGCAAWQDADPRAVNVFTAATARMWQTFADRRPNASWIQAMAEAARTWADHRDIALAR